MLMPKQTWKNLNEIKGMEIYKDYEVSNTGKIRSLKFGKKRIMKLRINQDGYAQVNLYANGTKKNFYVHRIVALAFIPNDNSLEKIEVNHINEITSDNRIENLEWCTPKYNNNYGTRIKRAKETKRTRGRRKILCLETGEKYNSVSEVIRELELCQVWSCGDYHFKFLE